MGELKKIAKEIKKDHDLAMELWSTGEFYPSLLATLIFDKKLLTQEVIDQLVSDLGSFDEDDRDRVSEWLMANQLTKDKGTIALMLTWQDHASPTLRRLFWYYQARLRWTGQVPPDNTADLVKSLEKDLGKADPEVQWAMNFCAGWIGIHDKKYRARLVKLGRQLGLYEGEKVAKNCTPAYLPEFIRIEVAKREK